MGNVLCILDDREMAGVTGVIWTCQVNIQKHTVFLHFLLTVLITGEDGSSNKDVKY